MLPFRRLTSPSKSCVTRASHETRRQALCQQGLHNGAEDGEMSTMTKAAQQTA